LPSDTPWISPSQQIATVPRRLGGIGGSRLNSCTMTSMNTPQSGNSTGELFRSGENWKLNACVNYIHDDWDLYAEGFFRAVTNLVRTVAETDGQDIDFLIYPIVFCSRHALELQLKSSVRRGKLLLEKQSVAYPQGHKLILDSGERSLWKECRAIAEAVWPDGSTDQLDKIEAILLEFAKYDPDGQAFRYPIDTKGSRTKADLTHINIETFYKLTKEAYRMLDGMASAYEQLYEQQQEMEH